MKGEGKEIQVNFQLIISWEIFKLEGQFTRQIIKCTDTWYKLKP